MYIDTSSKEPYRTPDELNRDDNWTTLRNGRTGYWGDLLVPPYVDPFCWTQFPVYENIYFVLQGKKYAHVCRSLYVSLLSEAKDFKSAHTTSTSHSLDNLLQCVVTQYPTRRSATTVRGHALWKTEIGIIMSVPIIRTLIGKIVLAK